MVNRLTFFSRPIAIAGAFLLLSASIEAQTVPSDRNILESGMGAGMASYADPNDYPGPKHILDLADTLNLTEDQIKLIEAISDGMIANSQALGMKIIEREERLEELFRSGTAGEKETRAIAVDIGTLRGDLRSVHLAAHIQAREVLSSGQRTLYTVLRYGPAPPLPGSRAVRKGTP
jgi:Spy/CpxP family protein refolding chaperone